MKRSTVRLIATMLLTGLSVTYAAGFAFIGKVPPSQAKRIQNPSDVPYKITGSFLGGNSGFIQAVRNAFATWDADNSALNFREVGSGEKLLIKSEASPACSGCLAYTQFFYTGSTITSGTVTFDADSFNWTTNPPPGFDVESVALHEIGHTIGLDHPNQADDVGRNYNCNLQPVNATGQEVMNSTISSGARKRTLTQDDTCGRDYLYPPPVDSTAPATVNNLSWTNVSSTSVRLSWKAPGDDGYSGTASSYDIRWSNAPITGSNFSSANVYSPAPDPVQGGTTQQLTVNAPLNDEQLFYFALKARDERNNVSGMSNVIVVDLVKPQAVSNLEVVDAGLDWVRLQWSATGDDGGVGSASSYDLRASTSAITSSNFSSATPVSGVGQPADAGTLETFTVTGLSPGVRYYFALKVSDEVPNTSGISNAVSGVTQADSDGDGLSDADELVFGSNPYVPDTDGDGMNDYYEYLAGTDPNDPESGRKDLFNDDFNDGDLAGWSESGAASNINWSAAGGFLKVTSNGLGGAAYLLAGPLDLSQVPSVAIAYDVTFKDGVTGGGLWFRGVRLDVNPSNCAWKDSSVRQYAGTSSGKHHVLVLIREASPYYLSDLYVDGKAVFLNEPIQVSSWGNNSAGFVSQSGSGTLEYDNFVVWPNPNPMILRGEYSDNFNDASYGAWISGGTSAVKWTFLSGSLKASGSSSSPAYSTMKQAILDVSSKDVILEFSVLFLSGASWAGLVYRGVRLDMGPSGISWVDDQVQSYGGLQADVWHRVTLIIRVQPQSQALSDLYVDGNPVFQDEPIDVPEYADNTVGFSRRAEAGSVLFDNFSITAVDTGTELPPVLFRIGLQKAVPDAPFTLQLNGIDPGAGTLSYSLSSSELPATGPYLDSQTGLFTWEPSASNAGVYSVRFEAANAEQSDGEDTRIVVASNPEVSCTYRQEFESDPDPLEDWQATGKTVNVSWTVEDGTLTARLTGTNYGFSYFAPYNSSVVDLSAMGDVLVETDLYLSSGTSTGGLYYRGVRLDLNTKRCAWADGAIQAYPGITANQWHHVMLFVYANRTSDLYVDGKPVFKKQLIQTSFKNNTAGYTSPKKYGVLKADSLCVRDFGQLSGTGYPFVAFYDFSENNLADWIMSSSSSKIAWSTGTGKLVSTVISSGQTVSIWPYNMDVSGKNLNIEFDAAFDGEASKGGLFYRGVKLFISPKKTGWADSVKQFYKPVVTAGTVHHVKLTVRQGSPYFTSDLYIDDVLIFSGEPIQKTSFSNNSVGFFSSNDQGTVTFDNLLVQEI